MSYNHSSSNIYTPTTHHCRHATPFQRQTSLDPVPSLINTHSAVLSLEQQQSFIRSSSTFPHQSHHDIRQEEAKPFSRQPAGDDASLLPIWQGDDGYKAALHSDKESGYETDIDSEYVSSPLESHCHIQQDSVVSKPPSLTSRERCVTFACDNTETQPPRPKAALACHPDTTASEQGHTVTSAVDVLLDAQKEIVGAGFGKAAGAGEQVSTAADDSLRLQKFPNGDNESHQENRTSPVSCPAPIPPTGDPHTESQIQEEPSTQPTPDLGTTTNEHPSSECFSPRSLKSSYASLVHELQSHIAYLELQNEAAEARGERLAAALIKGTRIFYWVNERRSAQVQSALHHSRDRVERHAALASLTEAIEEQNEQLENLVSGRSPHLLVHRQSTTDEVLDPFESDYGPEGTSELFADHSEMAFQDSNIQPDPLPDSHDDPSGTGMHQLMARNVGLKHQVEVLVADRERLEDERREDMTKQNSELNSLMGLLTTTQRENHDLRELLAKQDAERKWLEGELRCESDRRCRLERDAALLVSKRLEKLAKERSQEHV